jgi:large subunit ribosomal protein L7/L12
MLLRLWFALTCLCVPCVFAAEPTTPPAAAAPTKVRVVLKDYGTNKIMAIKVARESIPGLGLADAKKLVESAPVTIKETDPADAEKILKAFAAVKVVAEITTLEGQVTSQPAAPTPKLQGTVRVVLKSSGTNKIMAIKIARENIPGLGLADAKKLVESAPVTIKETDGAEAEKLQKAFTDAGATVELELVK